MVNYVAIIFIFIIFVASTIFDVSISRCTRTIFGTFTIFGKRIKTFEGVLSSRSRDHGAVVKFVVASNQGRINLSLQSCEGCQSGGGVKEVSKRGCQEGSIKKGC